MATASESCLLGCLWPSRGQSALPLPFLVSLSRTCWPWERAETLWQEDCWHRQSASPASISRMFPLPDDSSETTEKREENLLPSFTLWPNYFLYNWQVSTMALSWGVSLKSRKAKTMPVLVKASQLPASSPTLWKVLLSPNVLLSLQPFSLQAAPACWTHIISYPCQSAWKAVFSQQMPTYT